MNIIKKLVTKTFLKKSSLKVTKRYIRQHFKFHDQIDLKEFINEEDKEEFEKYFLADDDTTILKKSDIDTTKGAVFKEITIEENSSMTKYDFRLKLKELAKEHEIVAVINGEPKLPECPESFSILTYLQLLEDTKYAFINVNKTKYLKDIFLKKEYNIFDPMVYTKEGFEGNYNQLEFYMAFELNPPLHIVEEIQQNLEEREKNKMEPLSMDEIKIYCYQYFYPNFEGEKMVLKDAAGQIYNKDNEINRERKNNFGNNKKYQSKAQYYGDRDNMNRGSFRNGNRNEKKDRFDYRENENFGKDEIEDFTYSNKKKIDLLNKNRKDIELENLEVLEDMEDFEEIKDLNNDQDDFDFKDKN